MSLDNLFTYSLENCMGKRKLVYSKRKEKKRKEKKKKLVLSVFSKLVDDKSGVMY